MGRKKKLRLDDIIMRIAEGKKNPEVIGYRKRRRRVR